MKMKYLVLFVSLIAISCSGCIKGNEACKAVDPSAEEAQILAYAAANGIAAVKHTSGLYYQVINPGTGVAPTLSSKVYVTYTGRFLSGAIFDQSTSTINFGLNQVIEGWQIGLPLIKKGGKIKLLVPSAYAYGCNGVSGIPTNSILVFDIDLIDVQ